MNLLVTGKGHEDMGEFQDENWDKNEGNCQREVFKVCQDMPAGKKDRALRNRSKVQWADLGDDSDEDMPILIPVIRDIGCVEVEKAEEKTWDNLICGSHGGEARLRCDQDHRGLIVWESSVNSKWESSLWVGDRLPPVTEGECLDKTISQRTTVGHSHCLSAFGSSCKEHDSSTWDIPTLG